jgi:hypothetical protein
MYQQTPSPQNHTSTCEHLLNMALWHSIAIDDDLLTVTHLPLCTDVPVVPKASKLDKFVEAAASVMLSSHAW